MRQTGLDGALTIPTLAFAASVVVTSEFVVIGLLPLLTADLEVSLQAAGWLVSAFALSAAALGPLATLAAARWPAHHVLAACLLIFGLAGMAPAVLPVYELMLTARVIQGALLTLLISVASTTAAGMAPAGRSGRAIGHVNIGAVVGAVFAVPAGAALAGRIGWPAIFIGLGVLAALAAGAVLITVPATAPSPPSPSRQAKLLHQPHFLGHLLLSGLLFTAMFTAYSYIAALLESAWQLTTSGVAIALFWFGLAGLAGNWAASAVVDHNPMRLTAAVTAGLVATTATLAWTQAVSAGGLLLLALWGAAHTAAFVACQVRVMFAAPAAPAFAAALNIAVCNVGVAAGAALGGWIIARFGISAIGLSAAGVGVLTLAFASICTGAVHPRHRLRLHGRLLDRGTPRLAGRRSHHREQSTLRRR